MDAESGNLLKAGLDAFAIIGGTTAGTSGFLGAVALLTGASRRALSEAVEYGLAIGAIWGVPLALVLFFLELAGAV